MDAGGGNLKEITSGPLNTNPACSPDGQWVIYQAIDDSGQSIWKVPIDGGTPTRVSPLTGYGPAVSPDGKMVAFVTLQGTNPNVRNVWLVMPGSGGDPLYTLNPDLRASGNFRFTPDGKSLAYVVNEHGISNLWAMPLTGGDAKQLTDFKSDLIFDFAWSRDGKQLAISRGQITRDVVLLKDTAQ